MYQYTMSTKSNEYKLTERLKSLSSSDKQHGDMWEQWTLVDYRGYGCDGYDSDDNRDLADWCTHSFTEPKTYSTCLCSKYPIHKLNLMRNCYTREQCIIGCCCIKKFAPKQIKDDMKVKIGEKKVIDIAKSVNERCQTVRNRGKYIT